MKRIICVLALIGAVFGVMSAGATGASAATNCSTGVENTFTSSNNYLVSKLNFWNCTEVKAIEINDPNTYPPATGFEDQNSCQAGGNCYVNAKWGVLSGTCCPFTFSPGASYGVYRFEPVGPGGIFTHIGVPCYWTGGVYRQLRGFMTWRLQRSVAPYTYGPWHATWGAFASVRCPLN